MFSIIIVVKTKEIARLNQLIGETSPYLKQHAEHPVHWHPWGAEAFEKARTQNRPILLSIGYSACHWCHVMARESFTDEEVARIMNENFVNIKVDREERPDVDQIYQQACQAFTGQGGWPLTAFLTPNLEPFFVGTYFPPKPRYGLIGFADLLLEIARIYREGPQQVQHTVESLKEVLTARSIEDKLSQKPPASSDISDAASRLISIYDEVYGGFGQAPKFPTVNILELFLSLGPRFSSMALHTLREMAKGGIYDQVGGGFHRYATDRKWLVPHFEKMLYDNALLPMVYVHAYQLSRESLFARVTCHTLDWLLKEMKNPDGGFYTSMDADSEGVEGKYYVWRYEEINKAFSPNDARLLCLHYGISERGNFSDGQNILHRAMEPEGLSRELHLEPAFIAQRLTCLRQQLLRQRDQRPRAFQDKKIITAWNGLAIAALANAGRVLDRHDYIAAAQNTYAFIKSKLFVQKQLHRSYLGRLSPIPGFLDDYAYLVFGLFELYQATFQDEFLEDAIGLTQLSLDLFWDEATGQLYSTAPSEHLFHRPITPWDESLPSPLGITALNMLRLGIINPVLAEKAQILITTHKAAMLRDPFSHATLLLVGHLWSRGIKEVRLIGQATDPTLQNMLNSLKQSFSPDLFVLLQMGQSHLPLWEEVASTPQPTAYICHGFTCSPPVTDVEALMQEVHGLE